MKDNINPDHYRVGGMEPWDFMVREFSPTQLAGFALLNVIKYVSRAKYKNKDSLEDLGKANWYLTKIIKEIRKHPAVPMPVAAPSLYQDEAAWLRSWEYVKAKLTKEEAIGYAIGKVIEHIHECRSSVYVANLEKAAVFLDYVTKESEVVDLNEDSEGWIDHDGKSTPINEEDVYVDCKLRSGEMYQHMVSKYVCWRSSTVEDPYDIVAYRLSKEQE